MQSRRLAATMAASDATRQSESPIEAGGGPLAGIRGRVDEGATAGPLRADGGMRVQPDASRRDREGGSSRRGDTVRANPLRLNGGMEWAATIPALLGTLLGGAITNRRAKQRRTGGAMPSATSAVDKAA
jgi:hypothetical protein